jgi:hypothetical protein
LDAVQQATPGSRMVALAVKTRVLNDEGSVNALCKQFHRSLSNIGIASRTFI